MDDVRPLTSPSIHVLSRVKLVVLSPRQCWTTISSEEVRPTTVLIHLILPLSCLVIMCNVTGLRVFGLDVPFFGSWRPGFFSALVNQILFASMTIAAFFADAWIVQKLAREFQRTISYDKAFSLVAHASIPYHLAGLFGLFPNLYAALTISHLVELSALVLLYFGLNTMAPIKDTPATKNLTQDKGGFVAATIACLVLVHAIAVVLVPTLTPSAFTDIESIAQ